MSCDGVALQVAGLSKTYRVYPSPRARLWQLISSGLNRVVGREGPRYYREFHALGDVSFKVGRGETVGIIGRNGSGKSTLLQLICGTLEPSAGHVVQGGRIAALLELGSGFNPEFTGRENVYLNAALMGLSRDQVDARFEAISQFASLGIFIDQPIKTYSSGMVVRLAFATAIHVDPDILVVDEALAVGDTAFQQKCLQRIRSMQEAGVSILLVTHSANTLIEYCDRGIYIKQGRLVMDGPCRDVVKAYSNDLLEEEGAIGIHPPAPADPVVEAQARLPEPAAQAPALPGAVEAGKLFIRFVRLVNRNGYSVATVRSGDMVRVEVELQANEAITEPCFGIQISSTDGISLWSATTQQMGLRPDPLAPGVHRLAWDLNASFSGSRYVISIGAGELVEGEYRRRHRLDYAGHFDVMPEPSGGSGWLAPRPTFSLNRS